MISQDDARQDPSGHRMLYVLGFGIAGAILSNMARFHLFRFVLRVSLMHLLKRDFLKPVAAFNDNAAPICHH